MNLLQSIIKWNEIDIRGRAHRALWPLLTNEQKRSFWYLTERLIIIPSEWLDLPEPNWEI